MIEKNVSQKSIISLIQNIYLKIKITSAKHHYYGFTKRIYIHDVLPFDILLIQVNFKSLKFVIFYYRYFIVTLNIILKII